MKRLIEEGLTGVEIHTTSGSIAIVNLQAQIDGQQRQALAQRLDVSGRASFIQLVSLRGRILGCISDYDYAEELAERLTRDAPTDGAAFVARARARATFHRFSDALTDLDEAERLGADPAVVDSDRAAIFQAVGRYDEALTFFQEAAEHRADFESLGALATLQAERQDVFAAEKFFDQSRDLYRGVSPFPLTFFDFQRGVMWMGHGDLDRARTWLSAAHRRLPAYAPAQGHLAEVEASLGEIETALARLRPLTASSDDPDYAASLARILTDLDRMDEAREWRAMAESRYDKLIARHPEAFADHAAEFWLEAGADPNRALSLASRNLEIRQTPRAHELFKRAALAGAGVVPKATAGVSQDRCRETRLN